MQNAETLRLVTSAATARPAHRSYNSSSCLDASIRSCAIQRWVVRGSRGRSPHQRRYWLCGGGGGWGL